MGEIPVVALLDDTFHGILPRPHQLRRSKSLNNSFSNIYTNLLENTQASDGVPCDGGNSIPTPPESRDTTLKSAAHNLELRYSKKDEDRHWGGWEVALLKRKKVEKDLRYKLLLDPEDIDFLEDVVQKGCRCLFCSSPSKGKKCKRLFSTAKAVAALTLYAMSYVDLSIFNDKLSLAKYEKVRWTLFCSVSRAVLSIFDMDDFERMYDRDVLVKEYAELESILDNLKRPRRCHSLQKQQWLLQAFAVKGIPHHLSMLREHDICVILQQEGRQAIKNCPLLFVAKKYWDDISESDIDFSMDVIEKHSAMKDYFKTQLTLELTHQRCYSVFDTLIIRTLKGISLDALFGYTGYWKESFPYDKELASLDGYAGYWKEDLPFDKELAFKRFVEGVINGLHQLAALKSSTLRDYQKALVYPISITNFGDEDSAEIVKIADHERRKEGCRFTCRRHLLFALSLMNGCEVSDYEAFQWALQDLDEFRVGFPNPPLLNFICSSSVFSKFEMEWCHASQLFPKVFPKRSSGVGERDGCRPNKLMKSEEVHVFFKFGLKFSCNGGVEFRHSREDFVSELESYFEKTPRLFLSGS